MGFVPHEDFAPAERAPGPYIMSDIEPYRSPLGTGEVSSRSHRREDLKRGNCREVDPSEFKPTYHSKRFAQRAGKEWTPPATPKGADKAGFCDRKPAVED